MTVLQTPLNAHTHKNSKLRQLSDSTIGITHASLPFLYRIIVYKTKTLAACPSCNFVENFQGCATRQEKDWVNSLCMPGYIEFSINYFNLGDLKILPFSCLRKCVITEAQ